MSRPLPQRVALQSPIRQLRVEHEFSPEASEGVWRVWLTGNGDFTLGTFLELDSNGSIQRVTWHEDGTESIIEVKDASKE
jgi:hypothetical protein